MTPMTEEEEYANAGISKEEAQQTSEQPTISEYEKSLNVDDDEDAQEEEVEKKDTKSSEELAQEQRAKEVQYLDSLESWSNAKQLWKEAHPHENLKTYKKAYIRGFIDKLPWEEYLPEEVFEDKEFVEDHIPRTEGYVQNEEQENEGSIWKRIKDDKSDNTA